MKTIYFDWSHRVGLHVVTDGSDDVTNDHPTIEDLLDSLTEPTRLICEATFESFNPAARRRVILRCHEEGHQLRVFNPRQTAWKRIGKGLEKDDTIDALMIREVVRDGAHLSVPELDRNADRTATFTAIAAEICNLRRIGTVKKRPRSDGFTFVPDKDLFADQVIDLLPAYTELPDVRRAALGNGKAYAKTTVAAVAVVARHAESASDFDTLAGLHGNGRPSQVRSDLYHHSWRHRHKATPTLTLSDFRRELRWLYHKCRALPSGVLTHAHVS